jgi:DNA-binding MarR family transcriptional regulator
MARESGGAIARRYRPPRIYVNMVDLSSRARLDRALELMYFGWKRLVAAPDAVLARRGLARMHHRILYFVARRPDLSVGELLQALALTKQAVNEPLRALVRRRFVLIRPAETDRRIRRLRLTAAGATLEARLTGLQHRHLAGVFRAAGSSAERGWRRVMRRMAAANRSSPRN